MNTMFGYNVSKLQVMDGHDGYIMRGIIRRGKTPIAEFFNDGNGGQTEYTLFVKNDVFDAMASALADQYAKIGVDAPKRGQASLGFGSAFDYLIDDIIALNDMSKGVKKFAKKKGLSRAFASVISAMDKNLGSYLLNCVYSNTPLGKEYFHTFSDDDTYYLGTFASGDEINVVGGEVA